MNFFRIKLCTILFSLCVYGYAQVIVPEFTETNPTQEVLDNEYNSFDVIPNDPPLSTRWYRLPGDIGQRVDMSTIDPSIKYFEDDDIPYLTKEINGIQGRLFLKEVVGFRYTILDMQFVPYLDAQENGASIANPEYVTSIFLTEDTEVAIIEETAGEATNTTENNTQDTLIETDTPSSIIANEDTENKNSIIPLFSQRTTGTSLYIDVVLYTGNNRAKRETLYRYDNNQELIYTEKYVYTKRGGIQRLTRTYASGAIQRFVYYFATGGLKEVFYQDPDGSSYLLSYTLAGDLSSKILTDSSDDVAYELYRLFDSNNIIDREIERNFVTHINTEYQYQDNLLIHKEIYDMNITNTSDVSALENNEIIAIDDTVAEDESEELRDATPTLADEEVAIDSIDDGSVTISVREDIQEIDKNRKLLSTERYIYDEEARLVRTALSDILNEIVTYVTYPEDGSIEKIEDIYRNTQLVQTNIDRIEAQREEVFYFAEQKVLAVYYDNDTRIREEIFRNEQVVETRNYEE